MNKAKRNKNKNDSAKKSLIEQIENFKSEIKLLNDDEVFKSVILEDGTECPAYQISNYQRLWSVKAHRFLKVHACNDLGHLQAALCINGKEKFYLLHRLVAHAHVENSDPITKTIAHHKDEHPENCFASNIEWVTPSFNLNVGDTQERRAKQIRKPVEQYKDGVLVNTYDSLTNCSKALNTSPSKICKCIYGDKTFKDFTFKYAA